MRYKYFVMGIALNIVSLISTSCGPSTSSTGFEATAIPESVIIDQIVEQKLVTHEVVFEPEFDQCESSSGFEQFMQLGQLSSSELKRELIFGGKIGGEIGVSKAAKASLEVAVEGHFGSSTSSIESNEQGIQIKVPPYTKQRYEIAWREERTEGIIYYRVDDEVHTDTFSYRLGLRFVGSKGIDVPCDTENNEEQPLTNSEQSNTEQEQVVPTNTPTQQAPPTAPVAPPTISLWNEQSGSVPKEGTQIIRSLESGELLYLSGGRFILGDAYCGDDATQLCIVVYEANFAQNVVFDAVIASNNYVARTGVLTYDDLIRMHKPYFWRTPNCGNGCTKARIFHFIDGQLSGEPVVLNN